MPEIDSNLDKMYSYVSFSFTTIIALITLFVSSVSSSLLYTIIFLVILISSIRVKQLLAVNARISTYLEKFVEPYVGIKWETISHMNIRCRDSKKRNSHEIVFSNPLFFRNNFTYMIVGIISYAIYLVFYNAELFSNFYNIIFFIINTVILILVIINCFYDANNKGRNRYLAHWDSIIENLNINNTNT